MKWENDHRGFGSVRTFLFLSSSPSHLGSRMSRKYDCRSFFLLFLLLCHATAMLACYSMRLPIVRYFSRRDIVTFPHFPGFERLPRSRRDGACVVCVTNSPDAGVPHTHS